MPRRRTLIAALAAALALLGGCRNASRPAPDDARLSADKVCSAAQAQVDGLDHPSSDSAAVGRWAEQVAAIARREADDLLALRPTAREVTDVAGDLGALAALLDDVVAAAERDADPGPALAAVRSANLRTGARAREAGFASCGRPLTVPTSTGGDSDSTDGTQPSADGAFVADADRICRAAHLQLEGVPAPADEQSIATYLNEAYDIIDGLGRELSKLEPPAGGAVAFREALASLASQAKALDDARRSHGAGDTGGRDEMLRQADSHQKDFGDTSRGLGLDGCALFAR